MKRMRMSRPTAQALSESVLRKGDTFFDYGCGHGVDVALLRAEGFAATGWDPHFAPAEKKVDADVVNLGFVLNVIERAVERQHALRDAFALARRVLVVAVRVEKNLLAGEDFEDGVLTKHGGFQKFFTQSEFREYVEAILGVKPELAGIGVAYVFKSEEARHAYLSARLLGRRLEFRTELLDLFAKDALAQELLAKCRARARVLRRAEFEGFAALAERFGSEDRVRRLAARLLDPDALAALREERKAALLTYLVTSRLRGLAYPKASMLANDVLADLRTAWGTYERAKAAAEEFMFLVGQSDAVNIACQASAVGKLLPEDLYVHRSAVAQLPALLQVVVEMGRLVVGPQEAEIVKIARDGRSLSFLWYPQFDEVAHPTLDKSLRVHLPRADFQFRDFSASTNPPLLHRKEAFVSEDYAHRGRFLRLTAAEERAGLLGSAPGFQTEWLALLASKELQIAGHTLRRSKGAPSRPHEGSKATIPPKPRSATPTARPSSSS
ncbi:MAG: DNA phosphorothioation-associated putative methyltransferase [Deltaproteobacteria bacterium]|nr:DNA phosphorothioation-associated putative methyltransferase [Deltaproteobacteria bacterium]